MIPNHLCGSPYDDAEKCENLLYVGGEGGTAGKKKLDRWCLYCTAEGKVRKLGGIATFTGCSPTWCPKRKSQSAQTG